MSEATVAGLSNGSARRRGLPPQRRESNDLRRVLGRRDELQERLLRLEERWRLDSISW